MFHFLASSVVTAVRVIAFGIRDKGVFWVDQNSRDGFLPLPGLLIDGRCDSAVYCECMTLSRPSDRYLTRNICENARSTDLIHSLSQAVYQLRPSICPNNNRFAMAWRSEAEMNIDTGVFRLQTLLTAVLHRGRIYINTVKND